MKTLMVESVPIRWDWEVNTSFIQLPKRTYSSSAETIMTLANIINGRPPRNSTEPKTTLIVATPALITQWMSEINKHTSQEKKNKWVPLRVLKWHGKSKPCTSDNLGGIPDYDIVFVLRGTKQRRNEEANFKKG